MPVLMPTIPLLMVDAVLLVVGIMRPWHALVLLLGLLPFNGFITQVGADLIGGGELARVALAGWHDALLLGIVIAAAIDLARHRPRRLGLIELLVAAVLAFGLIYVVVSDHTLTAFYAYRTLYEPPALMASIVILGRIRGLPSWLPRRLALVMIGAGVLAALFALPQVYMGGFGYLQTFYVEAGEKLHHSFIASGIRQPRAVGTFTSPNEFGAYLAIVAGMLTVPGIVRMSLPIRMWALGALALALLLSFSRSGWLETAVIISVGLWLSRDRIHLPARLRSLSDRRQLAATAAPVLVFTLVAVVVAASSGAPQYVERTASGAEPSAGNRVASATAGLTVLRENPMGIGLGMAGPKAARFGEGAERPRILTEVWYLLYAIQVGILGAALLAALALAVLIRLWGWRNLPWSRLSIAVTVGLATGALFIPIIDDPSVFTPLWVIAGVALALGATGRSPAGSGQDGLETGGAGSGPTDDDGVPVGDRLVRDPSVGSLPSDMAVGVDSR